MRATHLHERNERDTAHVLLEHFRHLQDGIARETGPSSPNKGAKMSSCGFGGELWLLRVCDNFDAGRSLVPSFARGVRMVIKGARTRRRNGQ
eukprot:4639609-Pleurochrysis_carterae.AAC.3